MKTDNLKPKSYLYYVDEALMYNYNQVVNENVKHLLKTEAYYANLAARDFIAYVWWGITQSKWLAEVWVLNKYQGSFMADTIEQLSIEINIEYGLNEIQIAL